MELEPESAEQRSDAAEKDVEGFQSGQFVTIATSFNSDSPGHMHLAQGLEGQIKQVDNGDLLVDFKNCQHAQWVFRQNVSKLQKRFEEVHDMDLQQDHAVHIARPESEDPRTDGHADGHVRWICRHVVHISSEVSRLGMEVTNLDPESGGEVNWSVGRLAPGAFAGKLGLAVGDAVVSVNGIFVRGKDRAEVVLHLKDRPLTIELHRSQLAPPTPPVPPMEFITTIEGDADHGIELNLHASGPHPLVAAVHEGSPAWTSGVAVGDALVSIQVKRPEAGQLSYEEPARLMDIWWEQAEPLVLVLHRMPRPTPL
jgi:C-terminal processing protease CtpA/Prc